MVLPLAFKRAMKSAPNWAVATGFIAEFIYRLLILALSEK